MRRIAEAKLAIERAGRPPQTHADIQRLQHELEVHQIELELQNQELRTAQNANEAALERYTDLFDFAPVGYFNLGADGAIRLVNLTGAKLTGIERARLTGRRLGLLVAPEDRKTFSNFLDRAFGSGINQACEVTLEAENRTPLVVSLKATVSSDLEICRVVMMDITESKRGMEALRVSERRFKTLFDQAAMGVALADVSTNRFVQVNRRYCEITGYDQPELEHLTLAAITHPEDSAHDLEMTEKLRTGELREYTREKRYVRKDRAEIWVSLTVSAMWTQGEIPDYFVVIVQDITSRKLLEEQVLQAQKMEAIGTLAGGIAHDFNNILAAISGYTELSLLTLKETSKVRENLVAVLKATVRATGLVRQILAFSRQQATSRLPLSLGPIMAECIVLLRATIPTSIEFDILLAPDAPVVLADATHIHQILMNLGTNAWHAMKNRPGRLKVKLERIVVDEAHTVRQPRLHRGVYARISVRDTGCGMDQATLSRIFEPFFTTKPPGEGTGLGLAVVHGIMDKHDGVVTVQSTVGKGTVFHLYFPEKSGNAAQREIPPGEAPHGHGERILVVDDENLLVIMNQMTLIALGYAADITTKPAEALEWVRAHPQRYALVLTDQTMPGMTGLVLATQLQVVRPGLPVILTTGYMAALTADQIKAAGVFQVLHKPATLHALAFSLQAALLSGPKTV